jgi:peptidylprolyl isomerase
MRMILAAGAALILAACGERAAETPAADGAATAGSIVPAPACAISESPAPSGVSDTATWEKCTPWNSASPLVKKTGSGVEYVVVVSGPEDGIPPARNRKAEVFYEGRLNAGGAAFDSAFERGRSATFPVAKVVPGFSEALQLMKPGDRWLVFIPSDLGYGRRGTPGGPIPPNADLVFEIEMVAVH